MEQTASRPRTMTVEDLRTVLVHMPQLTAEGLVDHRQPGFLEQQEKLIQSVGICSRICRWLNRNARPAKHPSSSFDLTLKATRHVGYVTHGQFIAAAIHCGFRFRRNKGTPGGRFNLAV